MSKAFSEQETTPKEGKIFSYRLLVYFSAFIVACGIFARLYNLGIPAKPVFDEVYFPVFAWNFLHGIQSFDVHPPLGKFLMAIGLSVFGNTPFGWRIVPSVFGIALLGLVAVLAKELFKSKIAFLIAPIVFSLDGLLIIYSRVGLMDGVLLFFVLLAFYLAVRLRGRGVMLAIAILFGMAVGIKWIGIGVLLPILYVMWRKKRLSEFIAYIPISVGVYLFSVLSGDLIAKEPHIWAALVEWHKQAFHYHLYLTATHPWSSQWWSWPLMARPVLFFYEQDAAGKIQVLTSLGNPIVWWASTLAVIVSCVYLLLRFVQSKQDILDHPLVPLLIGYFTFFIPWAFIHRVLFIYHYMISYGFALLILTYWLTHMWKSQKVLLALFLGVAVVIGFFYLPLSMGLPLSQFWLDKHFWFAKWL